MVVNDPQLVTTKEGKDEYRSPTCEFCRVSEKFNKEAQKLSLNARKMSRGEHFFRFVYPRSPDMPTAEVERERAKIRQYIDKIEEDDDIVIDQ